MSPELEKREERRIRLGLARDALAGMLRSAPITDRSKIDKKKWAQVAFEWADAMLWAEKRKPTRKVAS